MISFFKNILILYLFGCLEIECDILWHYSMNTTVPSEWTGDTVIVYDGSTTTNTECPPTGSMRLYCWTLQNTSIITRNPLITTGYNTVNLTYSAATSLNGQFNNNCFIEYSIDGNIKWNAIIKYSSSTPDDIDTVFNGWGITANDNPLGVGIRLSSNGTTVKCYFNEFRLEGSPFFSSSPSNDPSTSPTNQPTANPTLETINPTSTTINPSNSPSNAPTNAPTSTPTATTLNPTPAPTANPTDITSSPTKTPTYPTTNPTLLPTQSPTYSQRACGKTWPDRTYNQLCIAVDIYPIYGKNTTFDIEIKAESPMYQNVFEVEITSRNQYCHAPFISFHFERIHDSSSQYIRVFDGTYGGGDVIATCPYWNILGCGTFVQCIRNYYLKYGTIPEDGWSYTITVFQSPDFYAACTPPYYINAVLSITCSDGSIPPTIDPTQLPTIEPTIEPTTIKPTGEPTINPTFHPTDTTASPTSYPTVTGFNCESNTNCYYANIYPVIGTETSIQIGIQHRSYLYYNIYITPRGNPCVTPKISLEFEETDFGNSKEYISVYDGVYNTSLISKCFGSTTCGNWISCFSDQLLQVNQIYTNDTHQLTVYKSYEVQRIFCLYAINAKLTFFCSGDTAQPTTAEPTVFPTAMTMNPTVNPTQLTLSPTETSLSPTIDPTTITSIPTFIPTVSPTYNKISCGDHRYCINADIFPQLATITTTDIKIQNIDENEDIVFEIHIIPNGVYCMHPTISFRYELIDTHYSSEYIAIFTGNSTAYRDLIQTCWIYYKYINSCGTFLECITNYYLGVDQIDVGDAFIITIHQMDEVDASCSHPYTVNAVLTVGCSNSTQSPTVEPTLQPIATKEPTLEPTLSPTTSESTDSSPFSDIPTVGWVLISIAAIIGCCCLSGVAICLYDQIEKRFCPKSNKADSSRSLIEISKNGNTKEIEMQQTSAQHSNFEDNVSNETGSASQSRSKTEIVCNTMKNCRECCCDKLNNCKEAFYNLPFIRTIRKYWDYIIWLILFCVAIGDIVSDIQVVLTWWALPSFCPQFKCPTFSTLVDPHITAIILLICVITGFVIGLYMKISDAKSLYKIYNLNGENSKKSADYKEEPNDQKNSKCINVNHADNNKKKLENEIKRETGKDDNNLENSASSHTNDSIIDSDEEKHDNSDQQEQYIDEQRCRNVAENDDTEQIRHWLVEKVRLPQYFDLFINNGYDSLNIIKKIQHENELIDIGISIKDHRLKILAEILKNDIKNKMIKQSMYIGWIPLFVEDTISLLLIAFVYGNGVGHYINLSTVYIRSMAWSLTAIILQIIFSFYKHRKLRKQKVYKCARCCHCCWSTLLCIPVIIMVLFVLALYLVWKPDPFIDLQHVPDPEQTLCPTFNKYTEFVGDLVEPPYLLYDNCTGLNYEYELLCNAVETNLHCRLDWDYKYMIDNTTSTIVDVSNHSDEIIKSKYLYHKHDCYNFDDFCSFDLALGTCGNYTIHCMNQFYFFDGNPMMWACFDFCRV